MSILRVYLLVKYIQLRYAERVYSILFYHEKRFSSNTNASEKHVAYSTPAGKDDSKACCSHLHTILTRKFKFNLKNASKKQAACFATSSQ